jgi:hypothetical protein
MRRGRFDATRTLLQVRNRGLIGATKAAVCRSTPIQGSRLSGGVLAASALISDGDDLAGHLKAPVLRQPNNKRH